MPQRELTPEEKAKKEAFSKKCRERQLGKKHSQETKDKIGNAGRGFRHTDETKKKASERQRGVRRGHEKKGDE